MQLNSQKKLMSKELDAQVVRELEKLSKLSSLIIDRPFKSFSKKAFSQFAEVAGERKEKMRDQTVVMQKILRSEIEPGEQGNAKHDEWYLIERALKFYGLRLKDDFQNILQKDDVIEIYSAEHIQIFRTFNFYKYSAYSYMDLLLNEWYHLWERPSHILNSLYETGVSVVKGMQSGIVSMDHVPEHVYKEIYNSEDQENFESRSVKCKFGHISPLYDENNKIAGFIINCRVQVLGLGDETKKLSFI